MAKFFSCGNDLATAIQYIQGPILHSVFHILCSLPLSRVHIVIMYTSFPFDRPTYSTVVATLMVCGQKGSRARSQAGCSDRSQVLTRRDN